MDPALLENPLVFWLLAGLLTVVVSLPFVLHARRKELETMEAREEASRYGLDIPASLHPVVDPGGCIGISNCVKVCPEDVLGIEYGQAVAVRPARCIGHGLCERVCPVDAIQLVFGTATRGVELPRIKENFETNVEGIYVVGELGGMGLVANAFEQGRQCIEGIVKESAKGPPGIADLVIVGCGPAGLSASLTALHHGMTFLTLEKEDVGGTVAHYPRKKLVMTRPVKVPGYGKLPLREVRKEELMDIWKEVIDRAGLEVLTGETVQGIEKVGPHHFRVISSGGTYEAARVILAIGRRGVPRKLGVPGEAAPHVQYSLREPEVYRGERVLVVGGGDSAVEAALALADQPDTEVRMSYRRDTFNRIKPGNHDRIARAQDDGAVEVLWRSTARRIDPDAVHLDLEEQAVAVPADQVFIFAGGVLPTAFLRNCGIQIETKFGQP